MGNLINISRKFYYTKMGEGTVTFEKPKERDRVGLGLYMYNVGYVSLPGDRENLVDFSDVEVIVIVIVNS